MLRKNREEFKIKSKNKLFGSRSFRNNQNYIFSKKTKDILKRDLDYKLSMDRLDNIQVNMIFVYIFGFSGFAFLMAYYINNNLVEITKDNYVGIFFILSVLVIFMYLNMKKIIFGMYFFIYYLLNLFNTKSKYVFILEDTKIGNTLEIHGKYVFSLNNILGKYK